MFSCKDESENNQFKNSALSSHAELFICDRFKCAEQPRRNIYTSLYDDYRTLHIMKIG